VRKRHQEVTGFWLEYENKISQTAVGCISYRLQSACVARKPKKTGFFGFDA
jgi:hypothetical protein